MTQARRSFLSGVMLQAWSIYRRRHIPGCNVTTFADAMRNAWAWLRRTALPTVVAGPVLHLRSMVQSPMRRAMTGPYAFDRAYRAGRFTSRLGA